MRESNKFHRSNRKWTARILAYLLAFAMTVMSVPIEMVSAEPGGTGALGSGEMNMEGGDTKEQNADEGSSGAMLLADTDEERVVVELNGSYLQGVEVGDGYLKGWYACDKNYQETAIEIARYVDGSFYGYAAYQTNTTYPSGEIQGEITDWYMKAENGEKVDEHRDKYFPYERYLIPGEYTLVVTVAWNDGKVETYEPNFTVKRMENPFSRFKMSRHSDDERPSVSAADSVGAEPVIVYYTGEQVGPALNQVYPHIQDGRPHYSVGYFASGLLEVEGTWDATEITDDPDTLEVEVNHARIKVAKDEYLQYFDFDPVPVGEDTTHYVADWSWQVAYDEFSEAEVKSIWDCIRVFRLIPNSYNWGETPYEVTKDEDGVYWCGEDEQVKIGIFGVYTGTQDWFNGLQLEVSLGDSGEWQNFTQTSEYTAVDYTVEDMVDLTVHLRSKLHNFEDSKVFKLNIDNAKPEGSFSVNGVTFDDVFSPSGNSEDYTTKLFVKDSNPKVTSSSILDPDVLKLTYAIKQKRAGNPVDKIAFSVVKEGIAVTDITSWDEKRLYDVYEGDWDLYLYKIGKSEEGFNQSGYGANIIWMRLTDTAGNVTYVSSDRVIIYRDLEGGYDASGATYEDEYLAEVDDTISYSKAIGGSLRLPFDSVDGAFDIPVRAGVTGALTVPEFISSVQVREITKDESGNPVVGQYRTLTPGVEYTIGYDDGLDTSTADPATYEKGYVELNQSIFSSASVTTEYDVKVMLKPYAKTFEEKYSANAGANEAPSPVYFRVKMGKGESYINIVERDGNKGHTKTYDGEAYKNFSFVYTQGGTVVEKHAKLEYDEDTKAAITDPAYYEGDPAITTDDKWLNESDRADAGTYFMYAELQFAESSVYKPSNVSTIYTISPRPVDANIVVLERPYDGTKEVAVDSIAVKTTIDGKNLWLNPDAFTAVFSSQEVGDNMQVTIKMENGKPVINAGTETEPISLYDPAKSDSDKYENYAITFIPTQASITPKEVKIKLTDSEGNELDKVSCEYGSDPSAVIAQYVTESIKNFNVKDLVDEDLKENGLEQVKNSLTFSTVATYSSDKGVYDITAKSNVERYRKNYVFVVDTKMEITPRPLEVRWSREKGVELTYKGADYTTKATVTNLAVNTDKVNITYNTYLLNEDDNIVESSKKSTTNTARIKEIGKYKTIITVDNENYAPTELCNFDWSVVAYEPTDVPTAMIPGEESGNNTRQPYEPDDLNVQGWFNSDTLMIKAPSKFIIAPEPEEEGDSLHFSPYFDVYGLEDGIQEITYYLQNMDEDSPYYGCITSARTLKVAVDTTAPQGSINLKDNNALYTAVNKLLGYFFGKKLVGFSVDYFDESDPEAVSSVYSDVYEVYYDIIPETESYNNIQWEKYTKDSGSTDYITVSNQVMTQSSTPLVVWIKIVDKAGNVTEINSKGIVVYEDAVLSTNTPKLEYAKYSSSGKSAVIDFKNNTIKSVKIYNEAGSLVKTLTEGVNYDVNSSSIYFRPAAFDGLTTDEEEGETFTPYTIKVEWNPVGKEFKNGTAPTVLEIPLHYKKGTTSIRVEDYQTVYNGQPVKNLVYSTTSKGTVSTEYYKAVESKDSYGNIDYNLGEKLSGAPKDAGYYIVQMRVAESDDYQEAISNEALIYIEPKPVTAWITVLDKYYDSTTDATVSEIAVATGIDGEEFKYLSGLTAEFNYAAVGKDIKVTVPEDTDYEAIEWETGAGYANPANYRLEFDVKTAQIKKRPLGIQVEQINLEYAENINITKYDFSINQIDITSGLSTDDLNNQGFMDDDIEEEIQLSYNPGRRVHVNVEQNDQGEYEVVPHDIKLEDLTIFCNNYTLYIVDDNGNLLANDAVGEQTVKLNIYQRDLQVEWQVTNELLTKPIALKEEQTEWYYEDRDNNGTAEPYKRVHQKNTVIYNAKPYTVEIAGLYGIIGNDTVNEGVVAENRIYTYTDPMEGMQVEAMQLQNPALNPDLKFGEDENVADRNQNWDYTIPNDKRNFTWNIKYLDEYYYDDLYKDYSDSCGNIIVSGTISEGLESLSKAYVTGENASSYQTDLARFKEFDWITPAIRTDENGAGVKEVTVEASRASYGYKIVKLNNDATHNELAALTDADWKDSITLTVGEGKDLQDGNNLFTYAIKDADGYITSIRQTYINIDSISPKAELTIAKANNPDNIFEKIWDTITFGYFSKEPVKVTVRVEDNPTIAGVPVSGIDVIEYALVTSEKDYLDGKAEWKRFNDPSDVIENIEYSNVKKDPEDEYKELSLDVSFDLKLDQKTIVYVRIKDCAGNVTYVNSQGLVLYNSGVSESKTPDGETMYALRRMAIEDIKVNNVINLGYSIAKVYCVPVESDNLDFQRDENTTFIECELAATDYSVEDVGTDKKVVNLTIHEAFLKNLPVGMYEIRVKYSPLGETWDDAWTEGFTGEGHGDKPIETVIPVGIARSQGTVTIDEAYASTTDGETEVITHIYDGELVENPEFTTTNSDAAKESATFKFSSTKDENGNWIDFSEDKPVDAGTYCVQVTVPQDADYTEAVGTLEFTIDKATVRTMVPVKDKEYDAKKTAEARESSYTFEGIKDDKLIVTDTSVFTLTFTDENVAYFEGSNTPADKEVKIKYESDEVVLEGVGNSKPENYDVIFDAAPARIDPAPVTIKVDQKTAVYGDELPELTAVVKGLKGEDTIGTYTLTTDAQKGSVPDTYKVEVENAEYNRNYQVTEVDSTLTITKRVVDIAWVNSESEDPTEEGYQLKTTFDYDGLAHNVIPVITNVYEEDEVSLKYDVYKTSDNSAEPVDATIVAGDYLTVVTELDGDDIDYYKLPMSENESLDPDKTEKVWKIQYVDSSEVADFDDTKWYNDTVQIKAPANYEISKVDTADESAWGPYIEHEADSDADGTVVTYYLRDANGAITPAKTVVVKKDSVAPGGDIKVRGDSVVMEFLNTISFGLFYKLTGTPETLVVKVEGTDSLSGIKSIEYLYADNFTYDPETDEEADWNSLTVEDGEASIEMVPSKAVIFVKITDKAGNFTVMNSNGVVVYVDSAITTDEDLTYTKDREDTETTVQIQTQLKGNTVKAIKLDNEPIDAAYYTVQDDPEEEGYGLITILNEYLQTETVSEGRHTLTISYNPQGETYKGAEADAPVDTTIDLVVSKNENVPINIATDQFYYTGEPIELEVITPSTSEPVVTYAKKVDGVYGEYTTEVPSEVGTYRVKVTTEADSWYEKGEESFVIDINPCAVKIQVVAREIEYGTDIPTIDFTVVSPTSLPNGATKDDLDVELTVECEVNAFGKVNAGKYDVEMTNWNENYDIDFVERSNRNALVVKPRAIIVDWGTTSFDYDATEHGVSPIITNLISGESCGLELDGTLSATAADTYTAEIDDVTNDNYTVDGVSESICEWTISYNAADAAKEATLVGTIVNGWYTDESVLLVAPEGYEISDQGTDIADDKWAATISVSQEGKDQEVTYYLRNTQTNAITAVKTVVISLDATAPERTIKLDAEESVFERFMNTITFGLFFKDDVDVEISGRDAYSGVDSIKYLLSDKELTKAEAEALALDETKWTTDDSFSITEEQKVIVYAMITDKAGHFAIINTDGVVVYTDVDKKDISATYTKTTMTDVIADVTLNGNTVKAVIYGEDELDLGTHYDVDGDKIILKGTYLDTLDASAVPYNFVVTYYPGGVVDAPVDVTSTRIKVTVQKQTVSQGDAPVFSVADRIVYDGAEVDEVTATYSGESDGAFTVYYKLKDSDDAFTTTKPVNAGTYIAKAVVAESDNYNAIEVEQEFTIEPITIDDIVWPVENTYIYTEEPYTVTATVPSGVLSGETLNMVYSGNVGTEVGTYTATIESLGNSNYKLSTEAEKTFVWYIELGSVSEEILEELKPDSTPTEEGWYDDYVTIDAPEGILIRVQGTDEWKDKVVIVDDGENKVVFEIKDESTGFVSETEEMTFPIDRNEPDVTVTIAGKEYTEDATEDDPSVFAKDKIVIPLDGDDTTSDVTVYYQVVPEGQEYDENGTWTDASTTNNQVVIVAPEKATVYVKAIDEAGNETVVKTTDIVVYKDAAQETTEMEFTKTSDEPVIAEVVLNGNEIADPIKVEGTDIDGNSVEEVLTCPDDYTVDENGKITFNQDSLDELLPAGEYDVIISYKPLGQTYEEAEGNEAPADTIVKLVVEKADSIVNENELTETDFAKVYDGNAVTNPTLEQNDKSQTIVYEYKVKGAGDNTYSELPPTAVGEYTVRVTAEANAYYNSNVVEIDFAISKREVSVSAGTITATANSEVTVAVENVVVTDLAEGQSVQSVAINGTTTTVTDNGTYTLSDLVIVDADGADVTANYEITYTSGKLIVEHDTTLAPSEMAVEMLTEYTANDSLSKNDIEVTISYTDGYEKVVTDYVSNIDEIDMSKVGQKTVVISYTENGETITEEVTIMVAHNPASKPEKVDATMSSYEFVAGDELTTDDILVKVTYADGYEDVVTDFVSNIDEIDMTQVGEKTLVVSYNKNGQTVTDEIVFTVVHDSISVPTNVDATLTDYDYVVGESLNLDDMIVKVTYADGFTKVVTEDITTNAESLNMNEAGTKELKVSYTENGVTVTETIEITVAPNVDKDEANLTAEDFEQTYNGEPVDNPDLTINNNGQTVTYEYKVKDADDSTYTSVPPTDAGDYTVRITAVGTDKYPENVREIDFTIEPKEVTVSAGVLTALSNETVTVDPSTLTTIGLLDGHYIEAIDVNADTSIITTNGTYTLANAVVKDTVGNDVTSNYNYNYGTGTLIVEHNTSLAPTSLRIEKQTVGYKVGDVFTDDDVRVFAVYSDGYETEVTDYVTNASEIDMSVASMKVFEVSCDVDGTVLTNEIYIDVTVDPGRVGFEVIHVEDAPETAVKNDAEELKDVVLTDEDREMVATGEDYNIYLEVKNIEDEVPPADKAIVEELMTEKYEDSVLAMFIDVSLYKKIGESPATYVKNVDTPIVISIKIPDELISEDPEIARTYYIVRVHEGVPTLISGTFNKEDNTFVFATDRFSTYAIMYKDVVVTDDPTDDKDDDVTNNPTDDKDDDVTNNPTDDKDDDKAPQTGDNTNAMLWILLMAAGCGMVVLGKRKKSNF